MAENWLLWEKTRLVSLTTKYWDTPKKLDYPITLWCSVFAKERTRFKRQHARNFLLLESIQNKHSSRASYSLFVLTALNSSLLFWMMHVFVAMWLIIAVWYDSSLKGGRPINSETGHYGNWTKSQAIEWAPCFLKLNE